jgi:hypothetical protein
VDRIVVLIAALALVLFLGVLFLTAVLGFRELRRFLRGQF